MGRPGMMVPSRLFVKWPYRGRIVAVSWPYRCGRIAYVSLNPTVCAGVPISPCWFDVHGAPGRGETERAALCQLRPRVSQNE